MVWARVKQGFAFLERFYRWLQVALSPAFQYYAEGRARLDRKQAAKNVATALRRTLAMARMYGIEHPVYKGDFLRLFNALNFRLRRQGELTLKVEADRLTFEGELILRESAKDPMIEMLYRDGIASITFHLVMTPEALEKYLELWYRAIMVPDDPERSFASIMWEADVPGITTRLRWAFGEYSGGLSDELKMAFEQRLRAIRGLAEAGEDEVRSRIVEKLQKEGHLREATRARTEQLGEGEINALHGAVSSSGKGAGQRTLMRLWYEFRTLPIEESHELLHLAAAIIDGLARAGRTEELVKAFTRITGSTRGDRTADEQLARFRLALGNQKVVTTLVLQLQHEPAAKGAMFLLRELPASFAEHLVAACVDAPPECQQKVLSLLASKTIAPEQLAIWFFALGESIGAFLLELGEAISPQHFDAALRAALMSPDTAMQRLAIGKIPEASADRFRSLLEQSIEHADAGVRQAALGLLVGQPDHHLVPLLVRRLQAQNDAEHVQLTCLRALTTIGGSNAIDELVRAFKHHTSSEVRVQVAQMLAQHTDEKVRAALKQEAGRWFGDRKLIQTSKVALRRASGAPEVTR